MKFLINIILFTLMLNCFFGISLIFADELYFKDGRTMKGLIIENDQERVILSTINGEILLRKSDILQVFYDQPEYNHLYLGDQYINANEFDKAVQAYKEALRINPELPQAADGIVRALETKLKFQAKDIQQIGTIGIAIEEANQYIKVSSVQPNSDAEKQGIKENDLVLFVWDKATRAMGLDKVKELLSGPLTSTVKLIIERQVTLLLVSPVKTTKFIDPGIRLKIELPGLVVAKVIKNSPADIAGIKADDLIVNINGKSTRYMKLNEAKEKIKGLVGSKIKLVIRRILNITRDYVLPEE